ncbi:hypothetical protein ABMA27_000059 [Loxostege sticticalis]|uniref:Uncharacterized protein n=1 Tax=Loxostege sticticalis TaxID=481309 RepID=A0ABR3IM33_LOXSC
MENMKYKYFYDYEFYRGTSAAETARRINDVNGALGGYFRTDWTIIGTNKLNLQTRVDCYITLLNRHNNEGILNRIITCDEKWIHVWWTSAGFIHYSFGQTITADIYCQQLQTMKEELAANNRDCQL